MLVWMLCRKVESKGSFGEEDEIIEGVVRCVQHEVGVRNLEILNNTTDAKGRKLEVVKVHCPPPLFRTYKESAGVDVRPLSASLNACIPGGLVVSA